MEILEFGNKNKEVLLLIHGFETPFQVFEDYVSYFWDDYHIFVPILPGHNPKKKEEFISFDYCADKIGRFILKRTNQKVNIFAISMGGILAFKLIERNFLCIKNVILDGSPLLGTSNFMSSFLTKQYLSMTHKTKKRNPHLIKQATKSIIPLNKLGCFLEIIDTITDQSIIKYQNEIAAYKIPSVLNLKKIKLTYTHGTKLNEILAKKTARYLKLNFKANVICFKNKAHCENSIFNTSYMCKLIKLILLNK